jgi:myo-inositol-1(or 4)-monophosphatase
MDIQAMLKVAEDAALAAGRRLQGVTGRRINSDADNDVKLQEDVESEIFIRNILEKTGIPVLGEEEGGDFSIIDRDEPYWVVDPIDGTYNFLRGIPCVCVSIGLMRGRKPVAGAIYDFTQNELFSAANGTPLYLNGAEIKPAWAKDVSQALAMSGFPSVTDFSDENLTRFVMRLQKFKKVRLCGSAAIAMAWVACGRADVYDERLVNLWDVAAGLALIESAGGVWKTEAAEVKGRPLALNVQAAARKEFYV